MSLTAFNRRRRLDAEEAARSVLASPLDPEPAVDEEELDDDLDELNRQELLGRARQHPGSGIKWPLLKTEALRERLRELEGA